MLNIFLGRKPLPNYRLVEPSNGQMEKIIVKEDVSERCRKYCVGSI
jgi:phenylalanyl-tRNA synthetase beta chain